MNTPSHREVETAMRVGRAMRALMDVGEDEEDPGEFASMLFAMMVWRAADMGASEEMLHVHLAAAFEMWRSKNHN